MKEVIRWTSHIGGALFFVLWLITLVRAGVGLEIQGVTVTPSWEHQPQLLAAKSLGIVKRFANLEEANQEFERMLKTTTTTVKVLELSGQFLVPALQDAQATGARIQWLLLDPESPYIDIRAKENPVRDSVEKITNTIKGSTAQLESLRPRFTRLQVHYYDEHPVFRLVIVDDEALLAYYPRTGPAEPLPVYLLVKKGDGYFAAFEKYLDYLWERRSKKVLGNS